MSNKYLVIDGSSLLHRILHTPQVELENGLQHGFLRSLIKIIRENCSNVKLVVCWDRGYSQFRADISDDYKYWKRKPKDTMSVKDQLRELYLKARYDLNEFLNMIGILSIYEEGFEGDDLIAYSKVYFNESDSEFIIITEDRDMLQLMDERTLVQMPVSKRLYDFQKFVQEFKLDIDNPIECFLWCKAMGGDKSDNVLGIKGLGTVNAIRIFKTVKSSGLDVLTKSGKKADQIFMSNLSKFFQNMKLVDLNYFIMHNKDSLKRTFESHIGYSSCNPTQGLQWLSKRALVEVAQDFDLLLSTKSVK